MPTNIEQITGVAGAGSSSFSRHGREVSQIVSSAELATVRIAARAHIEQSRLDAIDHVASRAMQGVALVSQLEQQLASMVPFATSRLQAIGDMHAYAVAKELASFSRRLP